MGQKSSGKNHSVPASFFEIDDFDTHWEDEISPELELMKEPSVLPEEATSEVQAAGSQRRDPCIELGAGNADPAFADLEDYDSALPLIGELDDPPLPLPTVPVGKARLQAARPDSQKLPPAAAQAPTVRPGTRDRRTGENPILELDDMLGAEAAPAPPAEDPLLVAARDRLAMGDYSGALVIAEGILQSDPEHELAQRYAENCRRTLAQMFAARLGRLNQAPRVAVEGDRLRWLSLDHRAGFLLSLVDGNSTIEELLDISGMQRFEALRILCELLDQNVIVLSG